MVLALGILVPAALTSGKLAAPGADVVKVEQPPHGDRIRLVPPFAEDGRSPQHMSQNWGKRSIGIDVKEPQVSAVWLERFPEWEVPGGPVYDVAAIMDSEHFAARGIVVGGAGQWPQVGTAIRWQHSNSRAGHGLTEPPDFDDHASEIRSSWTPG